ncbi:hypothetical protein JCM10212_005772 [Sporobolomyces blumeae]
MEGIEAAFKTMSVTTLGGPGQQGVVLAKRPDTGGTVGRKIELLANVYRIKFNKSASASHYDVSIKFVPPRREEGEGAAPSSKSQKQPAGQDRGVNRETSIAVWDKLVASNPDGLGPDLAKACFDCRKNAFSLGKLKIPNNSRTYPVALDPETETRPAREFDSGNVSDQAATAIMALDVLLRHASFRKPGVVVGGQGRKFLDTKQAFPIGEGAQVLAGLSQSVRPTMKGLVVNLDTAFSPYLISGNLVHVCRAILGHDQTGGAGGFGGRGGRGGRGGARGGRGGRGGGGFGAAGGGAGALPTTFTMPEIGQLKRKLKSAKVRLCPRAVDRRVYQIIDFGLPAGQQAFDLDRGKGKKGPVSSATVVAAAAAKGQVLPARRQAAPAQKTTVVEYFKKTYNKVIDPNSPVVKIAGGQFVPRECVELLNGRILPPTMLSANQASNMINIAAKVPADRRAAIDRIRQQAEFGGPGSKPAQWGLEIEPTMMPLNGRVVGAPRVTYHQTSQKATPSWNLKDSKFLAPNKALENWAVVVFAQTPIQVIQGFFQTLMHQATLRGESSSIFGYTVGASL